jgi:hypothetical protein
MSEGKVFSIIQRLKQGINSKKLLGQVVINPSNLQPQLLQKIALDLSWALLVKKLSGA